MSLYSHDPRPDPVPRILAAAFLVLLVLPVAVAAETAASADEGGLPRHGDIPAEFSVAAPRVGDAGSYERSIVSFDGKSVTTIEAPHVRESFRIESPRNHYDMRGQPHRVNAIHSWIGWRVTPTSMYEGDGEDIQYFVDATDGSLVASQYSTRGGDHVTNFTYFPGLSNGPPLCGLENALQRGPLSLDEAVSLFASACRRAYYVHRPGSVDPGFVAVRSDPWNGGTAIGFQQVGSSLVVLAWFVPEIPYPVRLLEQLGMGPSPRFAMLDLTGFSRGNTPVAQPGEEPSLPPLPPVGLRPHAGVGPDESGVSHDYAWSEAWLAAQEADDVRAFLADHPLAVVSVAVYSEHVSNTPTPLGWTTKHVNGWWFELDDGRVARRFDHDRTTTAEYAVLPMAGPIRTSGGTTVSTEPNNQARDLKANSVPAAALIPRVEDVMKWWDAVATPHFTARGANGWLHNLGCDGCTKPWGATGAGSFWSEATNGTVRWESSFVKINSSGHMFLLVENMGEGKVGPPSLVSGVLDPIGTPIERILQEALADAERLIGQGADFVADPVLAQAGLPLDAGAQEAGPVVESQAPAAASAVAAGSTAAKIALGVVSGAAILAALAGMGKFFAASLFSRLRRDRALDHPARRTLMDGIESEPGIHLAQLRLRTGQGAGAARHHLAKLVKAGLVVERKGNGYLCYFPARTSGPARAAAPATKSAGARAVLAALGPDPLGIRAIAARTGLAPSTVQHHLQRLEAAGLARPSAAGFARVL